MQNLHLNEQGRGFGAHMSVASKKMRTGGQFEDVVDFDVYIQDILTEQKKSVEEEGETGKQQEEEEGGKAVMFYYFGKKI